MATSIRVIPKKRGRPVTTGKGTLIGVRLQPRELAELDHWLGKQTDSPSRPEAVRRLMEYGLACHDMANRRKRR